jgi:hypothetical protein
MYTTVLHEYTYSGYRYSSMPAPQHTAAVSKVVAALAGAKCQVHEMYSVGDKKYNFFKIMRLERHL